MTHNQIDESFCSYLGTNLLLHPTITSFLKYSKISYYNYKKNYENDLEFLDEMYTSKNNTISKNKRRVYM